MIYYIGYSGSLFKKKDFLEGPFRVLLSTNGRTNTGENKHPTRGRKFAIDNGMWAVANSQGKKKWNEGKFRRTVEFSGKRADWVAAPDIVYGGLHSLKKSLSWMDFLEPRTNQVLIVVQDGMSINHLRRYVEPGKIGVFIGGSTRWKWETLPEWSALCRELGVYLHVGRVNSFKRIKACSGFGVDSVDGNCLHFVPYRMKSFTNELAQASLVFP